jgi:RimJ/RimL family protein N-acetyltransferase
MAWDTLAAPGTTLVASPVESRRFGLEVHRGTVGPGDLDRAGLRALVDGSPADVIVLRYDVARQEIPALLATTSRAVLPAGALTYWEKQVGDVAEPSTRVVAATDLDPAVAEQVVRAVVRESFAGYGNHYTADPLLDRSAVLAGYEEWAVGSLDRDTHEVMVQVLDGEPVGVATVEHSAAHAEILLAGLVPTAQGRGLYGDLLLAVERTARAAGRERLVISTQVQNVRVQRAWARFGMRPFAAVETVHLVRPELLRAATGF